MRVPVVRKNAPERCGTVTNGTQSKRKGIADAHLSHEISRVPVESAIALEKTSWSVIAKAEIRVSRSQDIGRW
jgi:hypothetical protein